MNEELKNLNPENLWFYFTEILKIPRPSKKEEQIIKYLIDFGKQHKLETIQDQIGNVLIRKPGTDGMENRKSVVLQSHVDMVCEKNSDVEFDFEKDPIHVWIDEGWVKAKGTTLGADDGIGIAAQLALLASNDIAHGPIECLFTIDEETGLTGAFGLKSDLLQSKILLNLDSEDDGELFIGCAGGKDTVITLPYKKVAVPGNYKSFKISVSGLVGGHSGDDIQKGRANANKILNRALWSSMDDFGLKLSIFDGGNLRNAIAREAYAQVCIPSENKKEFCNYISKLNTIAKSEYKITEPDLNIKVSEMEAVDFVIDNSAQEKLLNSIYACPHGVIAWSAEIPNFVETSTNLAS
ncbi:MAG: beta-Ala-His dipeptidase, partial [Bacteroidales bacterium]|nr:beta-Ala-His dipeptidase [Bacteroidales bacterium]